MINGTKIALCGGIFGVCSSVAGYYFLYKQAGHETSNSKKTIGDFLKSEKFTLLSYTDGNADEWTKILAKYKADKTNIFSGLDLSSAPEKDNDSISQLKERCKSVVEGDFDKDLSDKARKWCVVPQSIKDRMMALQVTILDYSNTKESNKSMDFWKEKIKAYKGTEGLSSSSTWASASGDDAKIEAIKKDCQTFLEGESRSYDADFEDKYKKAVTWCG